MAYGDNLAEVETCELVRATAEKYYDYQIAYSYVFVVTAISDNGQIKIDEYL